MSGRGDPPSPEELRLPMETTMYRPKAEPASTASRDRRAYDSLASAAQRAGVSERTVRRWIADGRLAGYRVGPRILRVDRAELDALFAVVPTTAGPRLRPA